MVALKALLSEANPSDIAEALEELLEDEMITGEELPVLYRFLPKELSAEVFAEMDVDMQEMLILYLHVHQKMN